MTNKIDPSAFSGEGVVSFHRMEDGTREDYELLDRAERTFLSMCTVEGGVEIEEVARTNPQALAKIPVDPLAGVDAAKALEIVRAGRLPEAAQAGAAELAERLWAVFTGEDATLVEVNPLVFTGDGRVVALDAKVTLDGKVLMELGVPGKPAPYMSGEPFHRCTHTALSPKGEIYVSDGYGNSRVHKYSSDGKLLMSWGEPGTGEGEFNIVHNICTDADGWIYIADRENHRVQVFDGNGKYEDQWNNMHRPSGLYLEPGKQGRMYIGEIGPDMAVNIELPNCGPRVSIYTSKGELLARLGHAHAGLESGQFISPHGISVDSRGDIYVGEVSFTNWGRRVRAKGEPIPPGLRSLQKLAKVG